MKKLLVAAMGIAAAYGAFADPYINAVRFTGSGDKTAAELNDLAQTSAGAQSGKYIAAPNDAGNTNQYSIAARTGDLPTARPLDDEGEAFNTEPTTELSVKTQFGKPLEFYVDPANDGAAKAIGDGGLYFDSLVKFTVCDDDPAQEYSDAKIVMWLQEATNSVGDVVKTNIMVKAGYLSKSGSVAATPKVYACGNTISGDFDQKWHRVTIKAIKDITASNAGVPGFAIYIDGGDAIAIKEVGTNDEAKWDNSFDYELTEAAAYLNANGTLFPSLKQGDAGNKQSLVSVGFDGTGWLNDLEVTDVAPDFAVDHEANKATVEIGGKSKPFESIAEAVAEINKSEYVGQTATMSLMKSLVLDEPIVFDGNGASTITLDFAGFVLTNELADAMITNSATSLIITNSSETVGGIWCDNANNAAFYAANGTTRIEAGFFHGLVRALAANNLSIVQGYFTQDYSGLEQYLSEDKIMGSAEEMPGFNKVVDKPIVTYTITFDANGGVLTGDATQVINDGDSVEKPSNPTRDDYTFIAWFWDDDNNPETSMVEFLFSDAQDPVLPEDDITLYAQWEAPTVPEYTVTFRTNGVEFVTQNVTSNSTITAVPNAPVKVGYTFNGWYEGDSAVAYDFNTPVTGDLTLDAVYDLNNYTITYKNADGTAFESWATSYTAPASFTVEVPVTLPTKDNVVLGTVGSKFNGWTNEVGTVTTTAGLTANLVVFANVTAGSTTWVADETTITENTPASEVYTELSGSALASTDAKKLTVWAKANGKTVGAVAEAEADSELYDAYLLNCSEAQLEEEKAAFAIPSITFDEDGKPVIAEPTGNYNGTIQKKGSDDLSTWTTIDGSTHKAEDYQFFKLELVP